METMSNKCYIKPVHKANIYKHEIQYRLMSWYSMSNSLAKERNYEKKNVDRISTWWLANHYLEC